MSSIAVAWSSGIVSEAGVTDAETASTAVAVPCAGTVWVVTGGATKRRSLSPGSWTRGADGTFAVGVAFGELTSGDCTSMGALASTVVTASRTSTGSDGSSGKDGVINTGWGLPASGERPSLDRVRKGRGAINGATMGRAIGLEAVGRVDSDDRAPRLDDGAAVWDEKAGASKVG